MSLIVAFRSYALRKRKMAPLAGQQSSRAYFMSKGKRMVVNRYKEGIPGKHVHHT
jgi:hypothetical protein